MLYIKKQCNSIAKEVADGKAPPRKAPDDGVGGWRRPKEVGLFRQKNWCKDCGTGYCQHGRQEHQCMDCGTGQCHHGPMPPRRRRRLKAFFTCKGCTGKYTDATGSGAGGTRYNFNNCGYCSSECRGAAKKPSAFTCKGCTGKYTYGSGSGSGTKYNCGYCSSECECREAAKKAPRAPRTKCEHGRQKNRCKDCGTGYCQHGRQEQQCMDCGTGQCHHGRRKSRCMDCGAGQCHHGRRKSQCKDCGTGYCQQHGRRKSQCKDC
jgi:hypothetical protein